MPSFAELMAMKEKGMPQPAALPALANLPGVPAPAYQTPGIGDGIPGNQRVDGSTAPHPAAWVPNSVWKLALGLDQGQAPMPAMLADPGSAPMPGNNRPGMMVNPAPVGPQFASPNKFAQPFDVKAEYDNIMQQLTPPKHKPKFWEVVGAIGAGLQAAGGDNSGMVRLAQARRDHQQQLENLAMTALRYRYDQYKTGQDWQADTSKPKMVGRSIVQIDPQTGKPNVLYNGPTDFEAYAKAQNLQPGTPQYFNAVQDYVLRSSGPTALENDKTIDDYRSGNRTMLERVRQANRQALEAARQKNRLGLRGAPSYRDLHPRAANGGNMPTATGPNGQKMVFDGKAWVPVQ